MKKYGDRLGKMADKYYTYMVNARETLKDEHLSTEEYVNAKALYDIASEEFLGYWAIRETIRNDYRRD